MLNDSHHLSTSCLNGSSLSSCVHAQDVHNLCECLLRVFRSSGYGPRPPPRLSDRPFFTKILLQPSSEVTFKDLSLSTEVIFKDPAGSEYWGSLLAWRTRSFWAFSVPGWSPAHSVCLIDQPADFIAADVCVSYWCPTLVFFTGVFLVYAWRVTYYRLLYHGQCGAWLWLVDSILLIYSSTSSWLLVLFAFFAVFFRFKRNFWSGNSTNTS